MTSANRLMTLAALSLSAVALPAMAQPSHADMHAAAPAAAPVANGVGVVKAINAKAGTITLAHEPIAALGWPAMTMPFKGVSPKLLKPLKVGQKVRFTFSGQQITAIQRI